MSHDTPDTRLLVHKKCHIMSRLHVHQVLGPLGWTPPWVDSIHWIPLDAESQELRVETLHDTPDARPQVHEKCHMFSGILSRLPLG